MKKRAKDFLSRQLDGRTFHSGELRDRMSVTGSLVVGPLDQGPQLITDISSSLGNISEVGYPFTEGISVNHLM